MAREGGRLVVPVWFRRCRFSLAAALRIGVSFRLGARLGTRFDRLRGYARTVPLRFGWVHEALRVGAPCSALLFALHEGIRS